MRYPACAESAGGTCGWVPRECRQYILSASSQGRRGRRRADRRSMIQNHRKYRKMLPRFLRYFSPAGRKNPPGTRKKAGFFPADLFSVSFCSYPAEAGLSILVIFQHKICAFFRPVILRLLSEKNPRTAEIFKNSVLNLLVCCGIGKHAGDQTYGVTVVCQVSDGAAAGGFECEIGIAVFTVI